MENATPHLFFDEGVMSINYLEVSCLSCFFFSYPTPCVGKSLLRVL